jgi:acetyl esterase/lipase
MNRSAGLRSTIPAALGALALAVIVAACSSGASSAASATASRAAQSTAAPTASATTVASPAGGSDGRPGSPPTAAYSNVAYASTSSSQVLDIWVPDGATGPVPLVIFVHGGAFVAGDKSMDNEIGNVASVLAAGYAAASLNYRLSGEARFPAAAQDVKAAVRFLRANASQYGLDPDRFAAWGESAGGHLVALIGTTGDQETVLDDPSLGNPGVSSAVQAVVDFFGPTDFLQMDAQFASAMPPACNSQVLAYDSADSPVSLFLGAAIQTVPDQAAAANPITYIATANTLPVFLIAHGDSDCEVPNQQSQILHEALQAAGARATFNLVRGAGHDEGIFASQTPIALEMLKSVFGK